MANWNPQLAVSSAAHGGPQLRVLINVLRIAKGGNRVYATELVRRLAQRPDIDLSIATRTDDVPHWRESACDADILAVRIARRPWDIFWEREALYETTRASRPDVVHDPVSLLPFARVDAAAVVTVADLNFEELNVGRARRMYKSLVYRHAAHVADRIICISNFTAMRLAARYPGCRNKVRVIWCGHGYDEDIGHRRALAERCSWKRTPFILTFAHRVHKNAEAAVRILSILRSRGFDVELRIIGADPEYRLRLMTLAREQLVERAVRTLQNVSAEMLAALYAQAVCLVFLSYYEGFGLPALEAMALGCPVLASNCAALEEVVGEHGEIVAPDDVESAAIYIEKILQAPAAVEKRVKAAQRYAASWSWERTAQSTINVYHEAVTSRRRKHTADERSEVPRRSMRDAVYGHDARCE